MSQLVFLGGTCGVSTWRRDVVIPALQAAGVPYFNPQLGPGEWTPAHEPQELLAKAQATVLLFIIDELSRGVSSLVEVAYLIGQRRPLVLLVRDLPEGALLDGQPVSQAERKDLNRGRLFVRTLAAAHGIPLCADLAEAVRQTLAMTAG